MDANSLLKTPKKPVFDQAFVANVWGQGRLKSTALPEAVATPWAFLCNAVWTKDEVQGEIRQFPGKKIWEPTGELQYDYLRYMTEIRLQHRMFAVDKSRRMMITWWLLALYLYDIMTRSNVAHAVINKDLNDSAYLLGDERMKLIYDHIPEEVWPNKPVVEVSGKCKLGYEIIRCSTTGSYVRAFPQGAGQLRLFTLTWILFDEFAFQEQQQEALRAAVPCVQGGLGHIDIVTTPELGTYAEEVYFDME
jgi:hypothetical protein